MLKKGCDLSHSDLKSSDDIVDIAILQGYLTVLTGGYKIMLTNIEKLYVKELCYTLIMSSDHHIWDKWAKNLHRWGLGELVASFIEAAGPLTLIGAQAIYISEPILDFAIPKDDIDALASMLDEPENARRFAAYLREGNNP